ncbi:MAG: hypothetical protein COW27_02675 [Nitrosopumilales archaeon CG15_BIG_FIL_POST_REV_8_21_14_020_37_12]|nr:MAG: hypothetical protein COW27_02675 [Nitrosopumilales archaeon CG15_BIG_FIL_POST_REV_8_21_14_020_37_12]
MQEDSNPTKEYLFEYISKSKKIPELISKQRFSEIIEEIIANCYDKILTFGKKEETVSTLATGLLHYLLTNSMLPSQRKVKYSGIDIDIVIPDLKTLQNDPKKSLIIYIPKTYNIKTIQDKMEEFKKIQPETQNIWIVLGEHMDTKHRCYVLEKQNSSFSEIIFDIAQFVNIAGDNKFKILRV